MNKELRSKDLECALVHEGRALDLDVPTPNQPLSRGYMRAKRVFDIVVALAALPLTLVVALILLAINPIWNHGPLIFAQKRMGRRCRPFVAYKFRTMRKAQTIERGPYDPVEVDRITRLGQFLRRWRIDEFPQFINVLVGDMSVIGPRPDYWSHAEHYSETIPGYRRRHAVRPGITGLAQVDAGYAQGLGETAAKTNLDLSYIANASIWMDLYVIRRTVFVILTGFGAR